MIKAIGIGIHPPVTALDRRTVGVPKGKANRFIRRRVGRKAARRRK
jgi:hypothetical protein